MFYNHALESLLGLHQQHQTDWSSEKQSTKLRWFAFIIWNFEPQRKDQLFVSQVSSVITKACNLCYPVLAGYQGWTQSWWKFYNKHYSCCNNDNNDDNNNSHYNISDWMRIKLFDEILVADGDMCHQRQYSLLMKIFQKVVLVLLYTKTCICKKPFSLTQCTTPFIHLQSFYLLMWKNMVQPAWLWKSWNTR